MLEGSSVFSVVFERSPKCINRPSLRSMGIVMQGGTDLALYCDMLICADNASIGCSALRNMGAAPNQMWLSGTAMDEETSSNRQYYNRKDAALIGLVLKSVPEELLEREVEGLADRLS